jgi:hypothetical protein
MTTPSPQEPQDPQQPSLPGWPVAPGLPPQADPPPGQPQQPYPQQVYPQQAYPPPGYPPQGYPQAGYPQPGAYPPGSPQPGAYPRGWSPTPPAPRKRRTGLIIGVIAVVLVLCCGATGGLGWWIYPSVQERVAEQEVLGDAERAYGQRYDEHRVRFTVAGNGPVTITLQDGGEKTTFDATLPWLHSVVVAKNDFTVWVRAESTGGSGPQRCTIDIDGSPYVERGPGSPLTCAVVFSS